MKTVRRHTESITQQHFMQWLKLQHPKLHQVTASFPNEGKRSFKNASRMKAEGMKKGIPDLVIFHPTDKYHGMFIEFKSTGKKPSDEQWAMIELLVDRGYYCCICWTLENAIEEVRNYVNQSRELGNEKLYVSARLIKLKLENSLGQISGS